MALKSIVIPEGVTSIETQTFEYCVNLTSVTIPSTITLIGTDAFSDCESIENVYFNGSLEQWCSINFYSGGGLGGNLYIGGSLIEELSIPDSVTHINNYAFCGYTSITMISVSNNVTSIEKSAFSGCANVTNIILGSAITRIGYSAFANCTALETISFKGTVEQWNAIVFTEATSGLFYNVPATHVHCIDGDVEL
jgi:hypothetical protein